MTTAQERTHFGLWAICKSPIILGNDLTKISSASLAIITNKVCDSFAHLQSLKLIIILKDLIAMNQDKLGKAATTFKPSGAAAPVSGQLYSYWYGELSDGVVVALVAAKDAATLSVNFSDVPGLGSGSFQWREVYTNKTGSGTSASFALTKHDIAVLKVTKT